MIKAITILCCLPLMLLASHAAETAERFWIKCEISEAWGNVGAGMAYSQQAELTISEDGTWTSLVKRKGGLDSAEINAKGHLSEFLVNERNQVIRKTNAMAAENIPGSSTDGISREGPYAKRSATLTVKQNGKINKIEWPGHGIVSGQLGGPKDDGVRHVFIWVENYIPRLPARTP